MFTRSPAHRWPRRWRARPLNTTTPAEAYTALPKAHPVEITPDHDYRLRTDKVGTNEVTLV
ncbi:hypothetical protein GWO72_06610 [Corynebacterium macginleyi]|nr:hypothetical protein [Corynebacterium macginleyi]